MPKEDKNSVRKTIEQLELQGKIVDFVFVAMSAILLGAIIGQIAEAVISPDKPNATICKGTCCDQNRP